MPQDNVVGRQDIEEDDILHLPFVAGKLRELGLTASEFARCIGVPVEEMESWVRGEKEPPRPVALLIGFIGTEDDAAIQLMWDRDGSFTGLMNGAVRAILNRQANI